jgi:hypothetical protein
MQIKGDRVVGEYDGCSFALTAREIVYYMRLADKYGWIKDGY